jgi:hypothetical protein
MFVRFAILRWVVMNYTIDAFNINSTGGNICCDKGHATAFGEFCHCSIPFLLI